MKIIGLIQGRMQSKRLPGKVMLEILGKPMVWHIYNRLTKCKFLDLVTVSTGEYDQNTEICEFAHHNNIPIYIGSETDLIDRLYKTAIKFDASAIVRITADCPLVDPIIVDRLAHEFTVNEDKYDIVTNCKVRTFPHGLDVEIFSKNILEKMWKEIRDPELREWFPFYINKNPRLFRIHNITNHVDLSNLRWTVDYPEDFEFIKQVYKNLYKEGNAFSMQEVLDLLSKQPHLNQINSKYVGHHNVGAPNT
jgi:spore coat polysaccharide biosynthesis protein SpsF